MSSAMNSNEIRWFESAALDKPELRSPQPCKRGIHCDYKLKDEATGDFVRACCSGVHPGEEGTGRRFFPARVLEDGSSQPACVRLTGASQGFYERRRLRLSWAEWCEKKGIPFTPALPGEPVDAVVRVPLGSKKAQPQPQAQPRAQPQAQPQIAYSENQMNAFHAMSQHQERMDEREDREYRAQTLAERAAYEATMRAAWVEVTAKLDKEHQIWLQSNPPVKERWQMQSRGFLGMPGGAENQRMSGGGSTSAQPQAQPQKMTKNQRYRANRRIRLSGVDDGMPSHLQVEPHCSDPNCGITVFTPVPHGSAAPPPLNLRPSQFGGGVPVSGRIGSCSPDCCCPLGYSCHDSTPPSHHDGSSTPIPEPASPTLVPTGINYEEND